MSVDLNADVGESFGAFELGHDDALLRSVTSVSIACGFHAGDPSVMRRTVRLAVRAGVSVGAHPGFPDLQGFGRRELEMAPSDLEDFVLYQVSALAGIAAAEGARLGHVKPHGALYHMAARRDELATAVVRGVAALDRTLTVVAPPRSALERAARAHGLPVAAEAFADRAYRPDGSLVPRGETGAIIVDPEHVVQRALGLARTGEVLACEGSVVKLDPATLCLHGDTPQAAMLAALVRRRLEEEGVEVAPFRPQEGSLFLPQRPP